MYKEKAIKKKLKKFNKVFFTYFDSTMLFKSFIYKLYVYSIKNAYIQL